MIRMRVIARQRQRVARIRQIKRKIKTKIKKEENRRVQIRTGIGWAG